MNAASRMSAPDEQGQMSRAGQTTGASQTSDKQNAARSSRVNWLALGLRSLDAVMPALATRLASTLFLTPPVRGPRHAKPSAPVPPMQRFKFTSESKQLWAYSFGSAGGRAENDVGATSQPMVLLVHGWGGYGLQFAALIAPLVKAGFRVVAVDMPAHGASSGCTSNAFEFRSAILTLVGRLGQPASVIAHSFGAIPAVLAMQEGLNPASSVFLAPMTSFRFAMDSFAAQLELSAALKRRTAEHFENRFGISRAGMELSQRAATQSVPLLVVHDNEDSRVPIRLGRALAEAWPGAEMLATRGLGHVRVLSDARVVDRVLAFTRSHSRGEAPS